MKVKALASHKAGGNLNTFEYELGYPKGKEIIIKVDSCGICHSDLSMLNNDWGRTQYPFVPGHEIIGKVHSKGPLVENLKEGDLVGLGWFSGSCLHCNQCLSGNHNLCSRNQETIVNRHGGFATHVKTQEEWAIPLPNGIDFESAGPLFCGGITVFNPIVQMDIKPTDNVAVIGVGGLGHLAIQFLNKWGCEVTAFSHSESKREEALLMGAHHFYASNKDFHESLNNSFDFILSTVNVPLNWDAYLSMLAPKGRLHTVGAIPEPIPTPAFALIVGQRSISGSPLGSPATMNKMINFCKRHDIKPIAEYFPMTQANEALEHLKSGEARYRIILKNDL